jgi:hypothetical protein
MQQSDTERVERIAQQLAAYFDTHPNASDSIEGVHWWIPTLATEPPTLIEQALELLVARGVARKKTPPGGGTAYSAAKKKP